MRKLLCVLVLIAGLGVASFADVSSETRAFIESALQPGITLTINGECGAALEVGEELVVSVSVSQSGVLYIFDFDPDPDTFFKVFPSSIVFDVDPNLVAGDEIELRFEMGEPYGKGMLVACLVPERLDFAPLPPELGGLETAFGMRGPAMGRLLAEMLVIRLQNLPEDPGYSLTYCMYASTPRQDEEDEEQEKELPELP